MKHFAKFAVFLALAGMMLAAVMLAWPQRTRAATAATLDTMYEYKLVNEKSGLVLGINSPQTTAGSNALQ